MAVKKSPAFSFYPNDFTTGTKTMSLQEVGAYVRLLCYQWDSGSIPAEPNDRAKIIECSKAQERELWKKVGQKFELRDGVYLNERLEGERQKQVERRRRLSDNGKLGGRPGKANEKLDETNSFHSAKAIEKQNERLTSSSSSSSSVKNKERATRSTRFDEWYAAYPLKVGRGAALKAWEKIHPDDALVTRMLDALAWQRNQPKWTTENGKFIPNPATYLNQARWEDEPFFTSTPATARPAVPNSLRLIDEMEAKRNAS